jgi:hypothetical protein
VELPGAKKRSAADKPASRAAFRAISRTVLLAKYNMPTVCQPYANSTKSLLSVITRLITQIENFGANKNYKKPINTNNITRTKRNRSKL